VEEKPDGLERRSRITHIQNSEKMRQPMSEPHHFLSKARYPSTDADIYQKSEHIFKVKLKNFSSEKSLELENGIVSPDTPACPELIMFIKEQIFKGQMVSTFMHSADHGTPRNPSSPETDVLPVWCYQGTTRTTME
jgi:hypothetical protein